MPMPAATNVLCADREGRVPGVAGLILLSVAIQIPLALFLGHAYDHPIFLATGYLAGTGQNPYVARDLSRFFGNPLFTAITSIGYPPPWPLVLGGIYRLSYARLPNLFVYSLAIKAPVIAANVCLALLVGRLSAAAGAGPRASRRALVFMLFNPLLLYTSAAWGQFDTVVAVAAMLALALLHRGKPAIAAVVLALGVALKPIAIPLVPVCVLFAGRGSARKAVGFAAVFTAGLGLFVVAPFPIFGWSPQVIFRGWDAHLKVAGGLSWLTFVELVTGSTTLPPPLRFLGWLWLPSLAAGAVLARTRGPAFTDLVHVSLRVTFLLFLTRAWMSEPNVALLLPMAAILAATGEMDRWILHALWAVPLAFSLFNASLPQVLAPVWPEGMRLFASLDQRIRVPRLVLRCLFTVPWLAIGWRTVLRGREAATGAIRRFPAMPWTDGGGAPLVSLVLPTFNEVDTIAEVIDRAETSLGLVAGRDLEIIVVDDGSPDGTQSVVEDASRRFPNIRMLQRGCRGGLASAIADGLAIARGEVVAVMDADLQHAPEALPDLVRRVRSGADLAIMSRYLPGSSVSGRSIVRRLVSRCGIGLTHLLLPKTRGLTDPISGFFALRGSILAGMRVVARGYKLVPEIVCRGRGMAIAEVPGALETRRRGRSKMGIVEIFRFLSLLLSVRKERGA